MWGAGLPVQTVVAAGTGGQTLGDVLGVGGRASLTGTASAGAGPLQLSRLSDQTSLAADDSQLVLVGGS